MLVSLDEIRAAAAHLDGIALRTPLVPAPWAGPDCWVKPESLQAIGAFKIRGAYHAIASLSEDERAAGVVASSSGNHAQAVAWAAREFGVPAVIVIPDVAPPRKIESTRALGAEVVLCAPPDRDRIAADMAAEQGRALIPPFDHRHVIAGQGTVGLEIVEDLPDVDVVLVPVSGGGLVSGIAAAVTRLRPAAKVVGVEPELAGDAAAGFRAGERAVWSTDETYRTVADALRTPAVGLLPWEHIRELVHDVITVTEAEIRAAVRRLALDARLVGEPGGSVAVAAQLFHGDALPPGKRVAVLSGGNIDPALLADILSQGDGPQATA